MKAWIRGLAWALWLTVCLALAFGCAPSDRTSRSRRDERWLGVVLSATGDTLGTHTGARCWLGNGAVELYRQGEPYPDFKQQVPRDGTGVCMRVQ